MATVKQIKAAQAANRAAEKQAIAVLGERATVAYRAVDVALEQELSAAEANARFDGKTEDEIAEMLETERTESIARMQQEASEKLTPVEPEAPAEPLAE